MAKQTLIFALVALSAAMCLAGTKEREWQDARLLWRDKNPYFEPSSEPKEGLDWAERATRDGQSYGTSTSTPKPAVAAVHDEFVFETAETAYLIRTTRLSNVKPTKLDWKLKFALDKKKVIVIDIEGKEVRAEIIGEKHKTVSQSTR